jgi:hypothetical protein
MFLSAGFGWYILCGDLWCVEGFCALRLFFIATYVNGFLKSGILRGILPIIGCSNGFCEIKDWEE